MTDFETHPAGTDDLVARLRAGKNGQEIEAADRIEQLEAALTRANAATAAAYEVAARECDYYAKSWDDLKINGSSISVIASAIRALATADQQSALDAAIAAITIGHTVTQHEKALRAIPAIDPAAIREAALREAADSVRGMADFCKTMGDTMGSRALYSAAAALIGELIGEKK